MKTATRPSPIAQASRRRVYSPAAWLVLIGALFSLLALSYLSVTRLELPAGPFIIPSPVPPTPMPFPPPSPTPVEAISLSNEEAREGANEEASAAPSPAPSPVPEKTPAPTTPLPTPSYHPRPVPPDEILEALVAGMPLQDKIAQMLIVGFHGHSLSTSWEPRSMIGDYHVGGVVLLEDNARDPQQVSDLTAELQALAFASGTGIPLFTAIDHEGGVVIHITTGTTEFPGNMALAAAGQPEYAYISAVLAARELRAMGINMNLAPVLDVNDNPLNPVIGVRSFGSSPTLTAEYGRLIIRGLQDNGVIAVAKHFPGHGSVAVDSHDGLPVLRASTSVLNQRELVPFQAAIGERVTGIMTAHIAVPELDDNDLPATLSSDILTGLLRRQLGYEGLVLTDSLDMKGVSAGRGQVQAAREAVEAGVDILLSARSTRDHVAIIRALTAAVEQGEIPVERIDRSVLRILRVKYAYGLFEPRSLADLNAVGSPERQALADEIALQAVTLLRDEGDLIPLPAAPARLLLVSPNQLPPGASGAGSAFAESLRERQYEVNELMFDPKSSWRRSHVRNAALARAAEHDVVIFGEWGMISRYVSHDDQWQEELIEALHQANPALIVVGWRNPAAILRCPMISTFLTPYGNTPAQVAAVVTVLTGDHVPPGQLPMTLPHAALEDDVLHDVPAREEEK